jgi:hypothetical protein
MVPLQDGPRRSIKYVRVYRRTANGWQAIANRVTQMVQQAQS